VIVAEKDRFIRESYCLGLGNGFELMQAANDEEVMRMLSTLPVDAVIVSHDLPSQGGAHVCAAIRATQGAEHIPVIVVGVDDDDDLVHRMFDAGASDYMISPIHIGILSRRLQRVFKSVAGVVQGTPLERAQVESELFRQLPDAAILVGANRMVAIVNEAYERQFCGRSGVLGRCVDDIIVGAAEDTFEREHLAVTEMNCPGRGKLHVRVQAIRIDSGPWRGSRVYILRPWDVAEVQPEAPAKPTGMARVLVLEDYEVVSHSIRRLLEKAGHKVTIATSADEAVQHFLKQRDVGESFDIALLDLSIPGSAGGADVVKNLRSITPDLLTIVMSGAWTDPVMLRPQDNGFDAAMRKPFSRGELTEAVNRVLAKRRK
jgi:DNA-binding response OmpR family regulator